MEKSKFYYYGEFLVKEESEDVSKDKVNNLIKSQIPNLAKNGIEIVSKNNYVVSLSLISEIQQIGVSFEFEYFATEEKSIEDYFIM